MVRAENRAPVMCCAFFISILRHAGRLVKSKVRVPRAVAAPELVARNDIPWFAAAIEAECSGMPCGMASGPLWGKEIMQLLVVGK